jgi:WD40 repeat protein
MTTRLRRRGAVLVLAVVCAALAACSKSPTSDGGPSAGGQPKLRHTLTGHTDWIRSLAFSPDSQTLASGATDRKIILWDVAGGKSTATYNAADAVAALAYRPDGKELAAGITGLGSQLELWDLATGTKTVRDKTKKTGLVESVAYSPDGKLLACAGQALPIIVRDSADGKVVATLGSSDAYVHALAFGADSNTLAAAGRNQIELWDVKEKKVTATIPTPADVISLAFSPDGKTLAGGSNTVLLCDVASQKITILPAETHVYYGIAFSPDGKTVVSGADNSVVELWDVASRKSTAKLKTTALVHPVAISPDGKLLAAGLIDKTIMVWNMPAR